jgi:hypothetical protein
LDGSVVVVSQRTFERRTDGSHGNQRTTVRAFV